MSSAKNQVEAVTRAVLRALRLDSASADAYGVATIVELALAKAAQAQGKKGLQSIPDVQAFAHAHLGRLLNASPAAIHCRGAHAAYTPTFVSDSVTRLVDVSPAKKSTGHV
jgi:hypothetical protein